MFQIACALGIALIASFAFILYQAITINRLAEELDNNLPPF